MSTQGEAKLLDSSMMYVDASHENYRQAQLMPTLSLSECRHDQINSAGLLRMFCFVFGGALDQPNPPT